MTFNGIRKFFNLTASIPEDSLIFTHITNDVARRYNGRSRLRFLVDMGVNDCHQDVGMMLKEQLSNRGFLIHRKPITGGLDPSSEHLIWVIHPNDWVAGPQDPKNIPPPGYTVLDYRMAVSLAWESELQSYSYASVDLPIRPFGFPVDPLTLIEDQRNYPILAAQLLRLSATWPRPKDVLLALRRPDTLSAGPSKPVQKGRKRPSKAQRISSHESSRSVSPKIPGAFPSHSAGEPSASSRRGSRRADVKEKGKSVPRRGALSTDCIKCTGTGEVRVVTLDSDEEDETSACVKCDGRGWVEVTAVLDSSDDDVVSIPRTPVTPRATPAADPTVVESSDDDVIPLPPRPRTPIPYVDLTHSSSDDELLSRKPVTRPAYSRRRSEHRIPERHGRADKAVRVSAEEGVGIEADDVVRPSRSREVVEVADAVDAIDEVEAVEVPESVDERAEEEGEVVSEHEEVADGEEERSAAEEIVHEEELHPAPVYVWDLTFVELGKRSIDDITGGSGDSVRNLRRRLF